MGPWRQLGEMHHSEAFFKRILTFLLGGSESGNLLISVLLAPTVQNVESEKEKTPDIVDVTGRSIELKNIWNIVRALSKDYGVMVMSEFPLDFQKHMNKPVATPMGVHIRVWMAVIKQADHFVGCDSVGQHMAYAYDKTATVVIGSTYPINTVFQKRKSFM